MWEHAYICVCVCVCVCVRVIIFRHVDVPPQAILFCVTMEMTEPNCQFVLEKRGKCCRALKCVCVWGLSGMMCVFFGYWGWKNNISDVAPWATKCDEEIKSLMSLRQRRAVWSPLLALTLFRLPIFLPVCLRPSTSPLLFHFSFLPLSLSAS